MATLERPILRDAIIRHLRAAGSDSISGVARALSALESAPVHRLTIAGHLAAMTEEGILREVERPPSKHYQVQDDHAFRTIHERVGDVVDNLPVPAPDRSAAAIALLGHLYGRPVFLAELHACGFVNPGRGVEDVDASDEQRRLLRHLFREDGPHPLEIPRADPLLQVRQGAISPTAVHEGLRQLVLAATATGDLVPPRNTSGVQARLPFGGDHGA